MKHRGRSFCLLLSLFIIISAFAACSKDTSMLESVQTQPLYWPVGVPLPEASAFLVNKPYGIQARYAQNNQFNNVGIYSLEIILSDENGAELNKTVQFTLLEDTIPPVLNGVKDIGAYIGKPISYKNGITVTDNCSCPVDLQVDSSKVDLYKVGSYPITYTATDAAGNQTVAHAKVHVYDFEITTEMLNAKLDPIISRIITPNMTTEDKCLAIYYYVYDNIRYVSTSDKSDWVRAAYLGLDEGQGDCYTYFALSKAFFERLGIQNMEIQRSADANKILGETHFWNYVNVGDAQNPRWYHFDATHLRDTNFTRKLWLITEQQLMYCNRNFRDSKIRDYFYQYDKTGYPSSATTTINSFIPNS